MCKQRFYYYIWYVIICRNGNTNRFKWSLACTKNGPRLTHILDRYLNPIFTCQFCGIFISESSSNAQFLAVIYT